MYKTVSIIIPARTDSEKIPLLESIKRIEYPKDKIEIILNTGDWPSVQRNNATRIAKGDILYFFNKDSQPGPETIRKAVEIINRDKEIAGVGGPELTPIDNSYLQKLFGYAVSSYFAHWKMRARYSSVGKERFSNEKELLLSNLAIKKDVFLKYIGFNERLYPNEENELVNRIIKGGYKFIYSPDVRIYRNRRKTLFKFAKQFYRYGKGRTNQILVEGLFKNIYFFAPFFLIIYLVFLPFFKNVTMCFIPLFLYLFIATVDAAYMSIKHRKNLILLPIFYIIMHVFYGIGMLIGLVRSVIMKAHGADLANYKFVVKRIKSMDGQ